MKRMGLAVGAALLMGAPVPAIASNAFFACDGYSAPGKKTDGMTKGAWLFGLATQSQDIRRGMGGSGRAAVDACDAALNDPLLLPKYWLRRAHLLQAKATHQIDLGDTEAALETLAASDAAPPVRDLFFERSVGLANRALRAIALFKLERRDAALAELDAIDKARAYSASMRALTLSIRLAYDLKPGDEQRLRLENARLSPSGFGPLFWKAMLLSDFKTAAEIGGEVSFDLPHGRGDSQIVRLDQQRLEAIVDRADLAGARAYAHSAIGDLEGAEAVIAAANAELRELLAPLPPLQPGVVRLRAVTEEHDAKAARAAIGKLKLAHWRELIARRENAKRPGMTMALVLKDMSAQNKADMIAVVDMLGLIMPETSREAAQRDNFLTGFRAKIDALLEKDRKLSARELIAMIPRPETAAAVKPFRGTGDGYFLSDSNGFYTKRESDSDYLNVRYGGAYTNRATIEEMSLLAAAEQALKAGKDSFLVDSRLFVSRSLTTYGMYGINYGTHNDGYEERVRFLPVNAAELPAELEHSRWRLFSVAEVRAALVPIYFATDKR